MPRVDQTMAQNDPNDIIVLESVVIVDNHNHIVKYSKTSKTVEDIKHEDEAEASSGTDENVMVKNVQHVEDVDNADEALNDPDGIIVLESVRIVKCDKY